MQKLIIPGLIGYGIYSFAWPNKAAKIHYSPAHIRLRSENVLSMQTEEYDIMIIGGGSVGAGVEGLRERSTVLNGASYMTS